MGQPSFSFLLFLLTILLPHSQSFSNMLVWNRVKSVEDPSAVETPVTRTPHILVLGDPDDPANAVLYESDFHIVATITRVDQVTPDLVASTNVVYVSSGPRGGPSQCREILARILALQPDLPWIHSRSAGIDHITSPELARFRNVLTNAKGQYSSTLAEYSLGAVTYFAKDFCRLRRQQANKEWTKYSVQELCGATLGIIGYGDIGRATARLAQAYGMRVLGLGRRAPPADGILAASYDQTQLSEVLRQSDFIVSATPLTSSTRGMMGAAEFAACKPTAVFINVGRGPTVDEEALIEALRTGGIRGAALDVTCVEPLPADSALWELDNVLLSPHNMDQTDTFQHESTDFFVKVQLPRFARELRLYNRIDGAAGY